jgi:hypothetical protein
MAFRHHYSDNISFVFTTLGHRMLRLEAILKNGSGNVREIAEEYEGTVAALRQANAINKIFENPSSSAGCALLQTHCSNYSNMASIIINLNLSS